MANQENDQEKRFENDQENSAQPGTGISEDMALRTEGLSPRRPDARRWTALPADFLTKVQKVLTDQFDMEAQDGRFVVEGRIYPTEAIVRIGYLENGRLKQTNFEASVDLEAANPAASEEEKTQARAAVIDRLYLCIDAIGSAFEEHFDAGGSHISDADDEGNEQTPITDHWEQFNFEGEAVYMRRTSVNSMLEAEADRLLGLLERELMHDDSHSEDALSKAEIDSELALAVQKIIREGKHPLQTQESDAPNDGSDHGTDPAVGRSLHLPDSAGSDSAKQLLADLLRELREDGETGNEH